MSCMHVYNAATIFPYITLKEWLSYELPKQQLTVNHARLDCEAAGSWVGRVNRRTKRQVSCSR